MLLVSEARDVEMELGLDVSCECFFFFSSGFFFSSRRRHTRLVRDWSSDVCSSDLPMGRLGEPDEIARAAVFLASEDSTFMTGTDLLIDGGYTAW